MTEIARYGSMNQAAKSLHISQPWLSTSIRELEKELNFKIFYRTSRGVTLSPEGKELLENIKPLLSQLLRVESFYDQDKNAPSTLCISSGKYSFITKLCIDFYKRYFENAESFILDTNESSCQMVVANVFEQKSELGIIHISQESDGSWKKKLEEKAMEYHYLFSSESCVILRKGHPLLFKKNIEMDDLFAYPLFHTNGRSPQAAHFDETPDIFPLNRFKRNVYTNNRNVVFDFISNSNAIFIGNSNFAIEKLHNGLTTILYPDQKARWSFYWIKLENQILSGNAQNFISLLTKYQPKK